MPEVDALEFVQTMTPAIRAAAVLAEARRHEVKALHKLDDLESSSRASGRAARVGVFTAVDTEIQELLLEVIHRHWPFVSVLAEEDTASKRLFPRSRRYCVLLDPIDGTKNFIGGGSAFGHIVSLMKGPKMLASLVYSHVGQRLFQAVAGCGAVLRRGDEPPLVMKLQQVHGDSFLYHVDRIPPSLVEEIDALGYHARISSQNATDILSMFEEGIRGFVSWAPVVYDVWSPASVIEEAGGWLSDWLGRKLRFHGRGRVPHLLVARTEDDARRVLPALERHVHLQQEEETGPPSPA